MSWIGLFLTYWFIFFTICFIVSEFGQKYFYEEAAAKLPLRVLIGTFLLAVLTTWMRPSIETMFTTDLVNTFIAAIVWFVVFSFVFQFHPWHGAALGIGSMIVAVGLGSISSESMARREADPRTRTVGTATPPRVSVGIPRPKASAEKDSGKAEAKKEGEAKKEEVKK